jgi:hypothetical protein
MAGWLYLFLSLYLGLQAPPCQGVVVMIHAKQSGKGKIVFIFLLFFFWGGGDVGRQLLKIHEKII